MRSVGKQARQGLGRRGATALEFGLIAVPVLTFMFVILALGIFGLYQQVLDNAVRDVTRQVQINASAASSSALFVSALCTQLAPIVSLTTCNSNITYAVQATSIASGFAALTPSAVSAGGTLPNTFFSSGTAYGPNTNILIQVCWQAPFTIPFASGVLTAGTGGRCLYGIGAGRAEPYQ